MKVNRRLLRLSFTVLLVLWMVSGVVFVTAMLTGCAEEECLVWGENCSQAYKQSEYGTTSIQCCKGLCADHGGFAVSCGA